MNARLHIMSRILGVWAVVVSMLCSMIACSETDTTDKSEFMLYYTSMTDIGPGMTSDIAQPSYKGAVPSNFTITGVTLNGTAYTGDLFSIDSATGAIHVESSESTAVGTYVISVSCMAGGNTYTYPDVLCVNFLKRVPDGITVSPEKLTAEYADIIDANSEATLPTAQVATGKDHISITGYAISNVRKGETIVDNKKDPMFAISTDGQISLVRGTQAIEPGIYTIDLKLNTAVSGSDSEEGLFANALTVNITSKPLSLTYATGKLEEATEEAGTTSFASQAPVFKGSTDGIVYSIESVSPASDKFTIDATTGIISVAAGHGLKSGDKYTLSIRVKNAYSSEGELFKNAFTLNVVDFIVPISEFSYTMTPAIEQVEFSVPVDDTFKGDDAVFEFTSISDDDRNIVSIDKKTGTVSAKKKNKLTIGEHKFTIKASNDKNSQTAELIINVSENPNKFTYVRYGNNLGLTPSENYANQFRLTDKADFNNNAEYNTPTTDSRKDLTWSIGTTAGVDIGGPAAFTSASIDAKTGKLTLGALPPVQKCIVVLVTATAGEGKEAYSITVPVFFHNNNVDKKGGQIEYTPFVLQVNPKKGGRSTVPTFTGIATDNLILDYRRKPIYFNIKGEYTEDGTPIQSGAPQADGKNSAQSPFMKALWVQCGSGLGAKTPMSFYDSKSVEKANLSDKTLGYVDNGANSTNKFSVVINANQWCEKVTDGQDILAWADGIFMMYMTYTTDGKPASVNSGTEIGPIAFWISQDF